MGFFDFFRNLGSKIKEGAGKVWNGIRHAAGVVKQGAASAFGGARKVADFIRGAYDKVTRIPVIGNIVKTGVEALGNVKIPYTPISIGTAVQGAEKIVRGGDKLLNG
jgi:hypothetical protein